MSHTLGGGGGGSVFILSLKLVKSHSHICFRGILVFVPESETDEISVSHFFGAWQS